MLQRLLIQNYALIENLDIQFDKGFTIITGETGAGKSILLGGLGLILGQRADVQSLLDKTKKCVIEGEFNLSSLNSDTFQQFFIENEFDYAVNTVIRREITPEGKSRAFINDTPANLNQLKDLSSMLVDIHSQHETLLLNSSNFQLSVVDAYATHSGVLTEYKSTFKQWQQQKNTLAELINKEQQSKTDLDYFQFQFNELEEAKLETINQLALEQELQTLTHSEEIKNNLAKAHYLLNAGEINVTSQLNESLLAMQGLIKFYPKSEEFYSRLKSVGIELKDIAAEIEAGEQETTFSPELINEINTKLNALYHLQQKHKVDSVETLISIKNELSDKLFNIGSLEEEINKLTAQITATENTLKDLAAKISAKRAAVIPTIESNVKELLSGVEMPNAVLKIEQTISENNYTLHGNDAIRFLFSANKGSEYKELSKVASGGELSRLMLCIKALVAKLTALPTIIFDEIDTGISGEVAQKVGMVVQDISKALQVIAITHLPQMASKGNSHYWVYKEIVNDKTYSRIRKLNTDERVIEIAKMLSGENTTQAAIDNARELLKV